MHARRGEYRRALAEQIVILHRAGFAPALVLDMARHYAALGNPAAGIRLLSRYQRQLTATAPTQTRTLLAALGGESDLTRRIFRGRDSTPQTRLALELNDPSEGPLLGRVEELRRVHAGRTQSDSRPAGYRAAPGVSPLK